MRNFTPYVDLPRAAGLIDWRSLDHDVWPEISGDKQLVENIPGSIVYMQRKWQI